MKQLFEDPFTAVMPGWLNIRFAKTFVGKTIAGDYCLVQEFVPCCREYCRDGVFYRGKDQLEAIGHWMEAHSSGTMAIAQWKGGIVSESNDTSMFVMLQPKLVILLKFFRLTVVVQKCIKSNVRS